ncbi:UDP-N-acetylglucosamine 4,6-dehydratase [Oceanobacillus oncorhynchi subsp. incaldanensis]|uniref:polysaccharide biosynthesis protein n=1 Tax=Oceanobacillus oncorhynchi TaxID=545501 RepID=UPI001B097405|nr:nucleoside-diphosphate sugar epimerase/dehydratase [Oceanobacillus oncorhynchi]GIO19636.1 UDP-N-acetylglucosamine 4,6-dehydratase [Oceanobacillus oncorhynchi subsp. incaldanensis]
MTYKKRLTLLILLDSLIVTSSVFIAFWMVYPSYPGIFLGDELWISAIAFLIFHHIFAFIFKLYNKVWSYASIRELIAIVKAVTLTIISVGVVQFFVNDQIFRRALVITWLLHIVLIGGSRFVWRLTRDRYINKKGENQKRTLIIGAGAAGVMIARQLQNESVKAELYPVGFIDDDLTKQKMEILSLPVIGMSKDIPEIVENMQVEHIVIAIPSLHNGALKKLIHQCNETGVSVQLLPKIEDLMTGKISVSNLKNIEVEDLLGRAPVKLDIDAISEYVTGTTVMVTGAGGSIGSEICRQLMRFSPKKLLLVGHGEFSIYNIDMELKTTLEQHDTEIIPIIGDIQDRERIFNIVQEHKPSIIYHAAAHKHVPLMEYNPHEAVKNNIIGTKNVAEAADTFGVSKFVMVSTDKAVNPTNVMGASKRIAEMIVQGLAQQSTTKFVAVRFGNVLGSRGSVIPLFKKQIANGGPVTVTHEEMTRYFMTIPEASRLVIQAGTLAKGGEIFVLDMGEPVKISDLAKNLIQLSGYTEAEIPIKYSGLRPGEKMYEELLNEDEVFPGQVYEKIYVGRTVEVDRQLIIDLLEKHEDYNNVELKKEMMKIVFAERRVLEAMKA